MDEVITAFRVAIRHIAPFTVLHVVTRIVVLVVLVPACGLILGLALAWAGAPAMTDQDIALFLLSPPGFVAALIVAGVLFLAVILDLAIMTVFLRRHARPLRVALRDDLHFLAGRLGALFSFGVLLFLRLLALAAPFVLAAGALALFMLRDYDINYYLTHWPPDFMGVVALGGAILTALAGVLLVKLSGWALALHLLLLENRRPNDCFAASATLLQGHRRRVLSRIAAWAIMRVALFSALALIAGGLIAALQDAMLPDLRRVVIATLAGVALWALANAALSGLCNGALAALLDGLYKAEGGPQAQAPTPPSQGAHRRNARPAILILSLAAILIGGAAVVLRQLPPVSAAPRAVEVIAHRGAAAVRPENTLAAVEQALVDRADWVEIDVQETTDGEVVVAHDSDFMKLAGVDLKVWDATVDDLAGIDIGGWFDPSYADQRTPTLAEVLKTARNRGRVLIELKYYGHDVALEERVARIVEDTNMTRDVMIMSLKVDGVRKMRALRPDWPMGILAARAIGNLSALDAEFVAVNTGQVSLRLIRNAHAAGKKVYVWTVDDPLTMSRMISMGVDGLITNDPALARQVMAQRSSLTRPERIMLWLSDRFRLKSFELVANEEDA